MPNHTSNRLVIVGERDTLALIRKRHFDETGTLDLNTIVPMPEDIRNTTDGSDSYRAREVLAGNVEWLGLVVSPGIETCLNRAEIFEFLKTHGQADLVELALRQEQLVKTYGFDSWYSWSVNNWGTKWNCYDGFVDEIQQSSLPDETDSLLDSQFNSAWSPPENALKELSEQYPEVTLTLDTLDEGGGFAETLVFKAGFITSETQSDWASMAQDVFGIEVDDEYDKYDEAEAVSEANPLSGHRNIRLS